MTEEIEMMETSLGSGRTVGMTGRTTEAGMPGPVGRAHKAPGIVKTGAGPGVRTLLVVPEGTRIGAGPEVSSGTETMVLFSPSGSLLPGRREAADAFGIGLWLGLPPGR